MALTWMLLALLHISISNAAEIELIECEPPDIPVWGGYGPQQDYYLPGDFIHYYCEVDTYIGGNYYRRCEDTGDWTGDTPVCDPPSIVSSTTQSSTTDEESGPELAVDGIRSTCTSTKGGKRDEWAGNFSRRGELIRVMIFLPPGPANYEVVLVKQNGGELICGIVNTNIDRLDWYFHNCPGPNNQDAVGVKIRSLSNDPLKICEIQAHVLVSPKCTDPHVRVQNGRLRLTRQAATLVCDTGYTRSPDSRLECIRDGVWTRKNLYCIERDWEVDAPGTGANNGGRRPDFDPRRQNPDSEKVEPDRGRVKPDRERLESERERERERF